LFFFALLATGSFLRVERTEVLNPNVGFLDFGVVDPNALSVRIHFRKFNIPIDSTLSVFNVETNEQHRFAGWRKGSFLALSLFGSRAALRLDLGSESWKETHSIEVDYIEVETIDSRRKLTLLCDKVADFNEGNVKNTECSHGLSPNADWNIKSVVKLQKGGSCTGFFFGAYNRILTNKHCIRNPEDAKDAEIEIQYECTSCNGDAVNCQYKQVFKVQVRSLLWSDEELDAALLNLDYDCPDDLPIEITAPFDQIHSGFFPSPAVGDKIYIVHHPDGQPKKITHAEDGVPCEIIAVWANSFSSNCDTIGGSSGSPVFRQSDHKLIGLNKASFISGPTLQGMQNSGDIDHNECAQVGSRMDKVWAKMQSTQFKCCATFATGWFGSGTKWRICDDVPHVPNSLNDKFTSVKLTSGCEVVTYKDEHFGGSFKVLDSDTWSNVGSSFNNKISSMRFRRTDSDRCRVRFYQHTNHDGSSVTFTGDQAVLYKWNDVWSSFKILGDSGCRLNLYRDAHYRDWIGTYTTDQTSFTANDQISSFRIIPSSDKCKVYLYKTNNCSGTKSATESDTKLFNSNWNDKVNSVKIKDGCGVILYQDMNFGGDYHHFEDENSSSSGYYCHDLEWTYKGNHFDFHNKASSLKVYRVARQINRRHLQVEQ